MKQCVKRYVAIQLVTKPGFCPNRIVGKDGVGRCWKEMDMRECNDFNVFPTFCSLEDCPSEKNEE